VAMENLICILVVNRYLFSLTIQEYEIALRIIGLTATVLVCIFSVALPALKSKAIKKCFKKTKNDSMLLK
jgi:hypothetical protein